MRIILGVRISGGQIIRAVMYVGQRTSLGLTHPNPAIALNNTMKTIQFYCFLQTGGRVGTNKFGPESIL